MLPLSIEVFHLPSSTSFYSTVLQPLGLFYVRSRQPQDSYEEAVSYAASADQTPVLQIVQTKSPLGPLRRSSIVLTAPSRAAVTEFHACGLRANPNLTVSQPKPKHISINLRVCLHQPGTNIHESERYWSCSIHLSESSITALPAFR